MTPEDRRKLDERRDWLRRLSYVNGIRKHIESSVTENDINTESLAENLGLSPCIINRIFNEVKDDYMHRYPWLLEAVQ